MKRPLGFFGASISREFVTFSAIGIVNTLLHLVVLYILVEYFSVYYLLASFLAFVVAVTNSFIFNTRLTFAQSIHAKTAFRYSKFFVVSTLAAITNLVLLYIITEYLGVWYLLSQLIATGLSLLINFIGNKYWTYR